MLHDGEKQIVDSGLSNAPAAMSDTGCERTLNEDRFACIQSPCRLLWVVCDGMGGTEGGELAAQLAIESMKRALERMPAQDAEAALAVALQEANRLITLRRQNQAFANMGTTLVAAMLQGRRLLIANIGDSRVYLIRDTAIQQLTVDHTFVQELVDRHEIEAEDALSHPDAHILTRCLGAEPIINADFKDLWMWKSDVPDSLVLCSDGLYSLVEDHEIATIVSGFAPDMAVTKLVDLARERGGFDNITVVIWPLPGTLREEKPEGYTIEQAIQGAKKGKKKVQVAPRKWGRFWVSVAILSGLSFFVALLMLMILFSS